MGRQDGSWGPHEPSRHFYQKGLLILGPLRPSPTAQAGWAVITSSPLLRPEAHGVRGRGLHHVHSLDSINCCSENLSEALRGTKAALWKTSRRQ